MPAGLYAITLVTDGVEVRDTREALQAAAWWVVRVRHARDPDGLWCVYGGQPGTVLGCLLTHGPVTEVVAYPFDDATTSMAYRDKIEKAYMPVGVPA